MSNEKKLVEFREQKDLAWKNDAASPLTEAQKKNFKGLNYFDPNLDLSFELELDKHVSGVGKEVVIKTTGGDQQIYLKAGKVRFPVDRKEVEALVFEDPDQKQFQYYLLFRDLTTGVETYENGRMLQIPTKDNKLLIDFNYAYNPYSSYNSNWDCPITPAENTLLVRIEAGEKKFG